MSNRGLSSSARLRAREASLRVVQVGQGGRDALALLVLAFENVLEDEVSPDRAADAYLAAKE